MIIVSEETGLPYGTHMTVTSSNSLRGISSFTNSLRHLSLPTAGIVSAGWLSALQRNAGDTDRTGDVGWVDSFS